MDDQETAWGDINPPMVSARPQGQLSASLERLQPATSEEFRNELTACLILVAPVGMTEEARGEWLAVAWQTLKHLPADVLAYGCAKAREACDHPAKLVPAIVRETEEMMRWRRDSVRSEGGTVPQALLPEPERCTPEQAKAILEEFGLTSRFRSSRDISTTPNTPGDA